MVANQFQGTYASKNDSFIHWFSGSQNAGLGQKNSGSNSTGSKKRLTEKAIRITINSGSFLKDGSACNDESPVCEDPE
jgi:hypothetical protein